MKQRFYAVSLPTQRELRALQSAIAAAGRLEVRRSERLERDYYDTFDRRLRRAGLVLESERSTTPVLRLIELGEPCRALETAPPDFSAPVRYWPAGAVRDAVLRHTGPRALLPLGTVHVKRTPGSFFNRDGKLTAHVDREQLLREPARGRGRTWLVAMRIRPLRGYEKAGRRLFRMTPDSTTASPASCFDRLPLLAAPAENTPRRLLPGQAARDVLCDILLDELAKMEHNLEGVLHDVDAEFLHEFRVAGRRSRSLYGEFRHLFPGAEGTRLRGELAWLSRATCELRDLDVMTLLTEDYQARHPAAAAGMTRLRDIIGRRRAAAREVLTGDSGAERLRRFLADWRRYLDTRPQRALARATLLPESGRALRRVLAKFLRDARRLETPDYSEALHDLRKTGKKLRYLLESFRELFPVKELDRAVRRLRRLQASLGEIVDAHAQRAFLQGCLRELPATAEGDRRALERMAQRILQRGIDAGAVLPARLKALTGVRHAARLARQFETEP